MLPPQALDPEAIIAVQAAVIAELRAANGALRTQVAVMDGLIDDFTVMVRPLSAALALRDSVGAQLGAMS
jgi:hypothetical protein